MKNAPLQETALKSSQQGAAILLFFLIVLTASTTFFLTTVNTQSIEVREFQDINYELEKAKQGLISYTSNYHTFGFDFDQDTETDDEGPGRFPCPDINKDGLADSNADDCTDYVRGRLPSSLSFGATSTITISNIYEIFDRQFWYVISPAFAEISTNSVNFTSNDFLTIDGETGYIAVIIAPGIEVGTQDRGQSDTDVTNYLEQGNVSGTAFVNSYPANPDLFNDKVIGIKLSDLKGPVMNSVIDPLHGAMLDYWNTFEDFPLDASAFGDWVQDNYVRWYGQEDWDDDLNYFRFVWDFPGWYTYKYVRFSHNNCPDQATQIIYLNDYSNPPSETIIEPGTC